VNAYGSIKNVDLFMGGLVEKHAKKHWSAKLFKRLSPTQFPRLRTGDRFFWQNQGFSPEISYVISKTRLSDIIVRNTDTPNLQANVFIAQPLPDHPHHLPQPPRFLTLHGRNRPFLGNGH
jgi:peroxidase